MICEGTCTTILYSHCLIPLNIQLFEYSLNTQKMKAFTFIVPCIYKKKSCSLLYSRMSGLMADLKFNLDLILFYFESKWMLT
jgi:hypothetical protein